MRDHDINVFGQIIGVEIPQWSMRKAPQRIDIEGHYCRLEPFSAEKHSDDLLDAFSQLEDSTWTYLAIGPFEDDASFRAWVTASALSADMFFAIVDRTTNKAIGVAALMRMDRTHGVIEIGNLHFSPALRRTRIASEAIYLLLRLVFEELRYRRCEWKCNSFNEPSRRAAARFGFTFEGIFRQAMVVKGRNRDTAWFSIIDQEWPALRGAYEAWLAPSNFDASGRNRQKLGDLIAQARKALSDDPST